MGQRKPGLWHGPRRVQVVDVTARHSKPCDECAELPEERRLIVISGTARSAKTSVLCIECGLLWILQVKAEATRAMRFLRTGKGAIRE